MFKLISQLELSNVENRVSFLYHLVRPFFCYFTIMGLIFPAVETKRRTTITRRWSLCFEQQLLLTDTVAYACYRVYHFNKIKTCEVYQKLCNLNVLLYKFVSNRVVSIMLTVCHRWMLVKPVMFVKMHTWHCTTEVIKAQEGSVQFQCFYGSLNKNI